MREEDFEGLIFLNNTKSFSFGDSKIVLEEDFRGFWMAYMNSSNLIYVFIIFLELKIY